MARKEFPSKVKAARLKHCCDAKGVPHCEGEGCGAPLSKGKYAFDHDNPDGLTGKPTFENCRVLCKVCHDAKTKGDVAAIAKAKRREAVDKGTKAAPTQKIKSAGFAPAAEQKKASKTVEKLAGMPRRPLYVTIGEDES